MRARIRRAGRLPPAWQLLMAGAAVIAGSYLVFKLARGPSVASPGKTAYLLMMEPMDSDFLPLTNLLAPFFPAHIPEPQPREFESWMQTPDWLDFGPMPTPTLNVSTASEYIRYFPENPNPWLLLAPHNLRNAQVWLQALAPVRPITCVFGRRASRAERIFQAFDVMGRQLVSGAEVLNAMDQMRARAITACVGAGANVLEFERFSNKGWVKKTSSQASSDPEDSNKWQPLLESLPTSTTPSAPVRRKRQAYVALLTAANKKYADGALVLGRSLALFDASRERVLLATNNVPDAVLDPLVRGGWTLKRVEAVTEHWFPNCPYVPAREDQKTRWGLMSSKLIIFGMTDYDMVLYLDSDTVVTGKLGDMFALSERMPQYTVIAEGGIQHDYVNAGVMLVRPDAKVYADMMTFFSTTKPKKLFGNLIDCTEMGLINSFFGLPHKLAPDDNSGELQVLPSTDPNPARTAILPVRTDTKLAIGRPDLQRDYSRYCPWAIHFMRKDHCSKPWDACPKGHTGKLSRVTGKCDMFPYIVWCRLKK